MLSRKDPPLSLGGHFDAFIEAQMARGRYSSVHDVLRAGLRLLIAQQEQRDALASAHPIICHDK